MSKELIGALRGTHLAVCESAADLIEVQQKRIDELEAEVEQCCTGESIAFATHRKQLAASQAQVKVMREALERIESATMSMYATRSDFVNDLQSVAYKALAAAKQWKGEV